MRVRWWKVKDLASKATLYLVVMLVSMAIAAMVWYALSSIPHGVVRRYCPPAAMTFVQGYGIYVVDTCGELRCLNLDGDPCGTEYNGDGSIREPMNREKACATWRALDRKTKAPLCRELNLPEDCELCP